jgi:hypothetical protein
MTSTRPLGGRSCSFSVFGVMASMRRDAASGWRPGREGAGEKNPLTVDLAINTRTPVAPLEIITPTFRLDLTRLGPAVAYRAIAVEDKIADKVCATHSTYAGLTSTRSKDPVDLAILTLTMHLDARQLRLSIRTEAHRRHLTPVTTLSFPKQLADGYQKIARTVPLLAELLNPEDAVSSVNAMLEPALSWTIEEGRWDPMTQRWIGASL